jgi:hypothetical protein
MPDCKLLDKCIFFNEQMDNMPAMLEVYKEKYCKENNKLCARFIVAETIGRKFVPRDLFPHQVERAYDIINKNNPQKE